MAAVKGRPRPDMKGNAYAEGCQSSGRLEKYTLEWLADEAKSFKRMGGSST